MTPWRTSCRARRSSPRDSGLATKASIPAEKHFSRSFTLTPAEQATMRTRGGSRRTQRRRPPAHCRRISTAAASPSIPGISQSIRITSYGSSAPQIDGLVAIRRDIHRAAEHHQQAPGQKLICLVVFRDQHARRAAVDAENRRRVDDVGGRECARSVGGHEFHGGNGHRKPERRALALLALDADRASHQGRRAACKSPGPARFPRIGASSTRRLARSGETACRSPLP